MQIIASSTGFSSDQVTWQIGTLDPIIVLKNAFAVLKAFPELV
jgi:hypothetical protein